MTNELREKTIKIAQEMAEYFDRKYTPKIKKTKACNNCSLKDICMPELEEKYSVKNYINAYINEKKH